MNGVRIRASIVALVCALTLLVGSSTTALAQRNNQDGLVNVNLQDLALQVPVVVQAPVGIAANVCNVSVASLVDQEDAECDAENNSFAFSKLIANQMLGIDDGHGGGHGGGGGGGGNNDQDGLVNVNIQDLGIQVPVSVQAPIGVAANICNVSVLSLVRQDDAECDAENTSKALSKLIARQLVA
jgi:hypothetical protein